DPRRGRPRLPPRRRSHPRPRRPGQPRILGPPTHPERDAPPHRPGHGPPRAHVRAHRRSPGVGRMTASTAEPEGGTTADPLREADVRRAVRTLLRTPLLHVDHHPDELALVRRYRHDLLRSSAAGLGYRLLVGPGLARLYKPGLVHDGTRGLTRRNGLPFAPRRYMMLALVLAALTQSRRQVMVDELVAAVRSSAVDADIDVDLDNIHERRALHSALMVLVDLGVLRE